MKHFDTFSGYGGFTIAARELGFETIGFSEVDKYASEVLARRFPDIKNYGDITKIRFEDLPDFDLLTGGSPCQDLSIAGGREGLAGRRSGLFHRFIELLKVKKPSCFIWENVKGAMSSQDGWDFAIVQMEMADAGYDIRWEVCNARDFGIPHNRERIFVVGTLREGCRQEILSVGEGLKVYRTENSGREGERKRLRGSHCVSAITRNYHKGVHCGGETYVDTYKGLRRLTPLECERLMGLPDDHTRFGLAGETSDTRRYMMVGNGVVVPVAKEIVRGLLNGSL
jgi:DNA (cytosine-5)-methyltransferase 1